MNADGDTDWQQAAHTWTLLPAKRSGERIDMSELWDVAVNAPTYQQSGYIGDFGPNPYFF